VPPGGGGAGGTAACNAAATIHDADAPVEHSVMLRLRACVHMQALRKTGQLHPPPLSCRTDSLRASPCVITRSALARS
jgi:hypothetical protein